jgi:TatA/E family protein of Tat protein translocase
MSQCEHLGPEVNSIYPDRDNAVTAKKEVDMLADVFGVDGIIVLIVVVVLLFGGAAIPKLARNLGSAKNEFEKGLEEGKARSSSSNLLGSEATSEMNQPPTPTILRGAEGPKASN